MMKSKSVWKCLIILSMVLFFFCNNHLAMADSNKTKNVTAEKSAQIFDTNKEELNTEKPEVFVQRGHDKGVTSVFFSPDSKYL